MQEIDPLIYFGIKTKGVNPTRTPKLDLKVVYIRFIKRPDDACEPAKKRFLQYPIKSAPVVRGNIQSYAFPRSLSVLDMLKLGKVVNEKLTESINLFSFDINQIAWFNIPSSVKFTIEKDILFALESYHCSTPHL